MQSVQSKQAKRNLKIKKSKLTFGVINESSLISSNIIQPKQKKVFQITLRSLRQSNFQFKTINYKNYDIQRKNQYQKRKHNQRPLSLYLDGANPKVLNHSSEKIKQPRKKQNFINLDDKQLGIGLIQNVKNQEDKRFLASKKSLKAIILKQIQLKNKRRISQNKNIKIDTPQFSDVQQLFTLKKIQKPNYQSRDKVKNKSFNQKMSFCNDSFNVKKSEQMNLSQKLSVFSQRKVLPKSNMKSSRNPESQAKNLFPIVDNKTSRPLVTLNSKEAKKIQSQSYIVVKCPQKQIMSGKVYKKNAQIASLTKIMTFYTILTICQQYNIDYTQKVVEIIEKAQEMTGTSADIFSGEKYTLEQLFYAMMLPSGNDAAVAIACEGGIILKENNCKSINLEQENIKCFIKYMNLLAKNIGMITSNFTNPHGLSDQNNLSNPYELSLLIVQCLKFDEFLKVVGTKSYSCWIDGISQKREVIWQNTHKLLRRQGFIGGKTGVTVTAGPCLATIYKSTSEQIFITVVLRAPKLSRRFKQTRWILGMTLKQYNKKYDKDVKLIMKSNPQLDSDNSQDEQKFDFNKNDSSELRKRNKILLYEL